MKAGITLEQLEANLEKIKTANLNFYSIVDLNKAMHALSKASARLVHSKEYQSILEASRKLGGG